MNPAASEAETPSVICRRRGAAGQQPLFRIVLPAELGGEGRRPVGLPAAVVDLGDSDGLPDTLGNLYGQTGSRYIP
jgi:hypothetical protein